MILLKAAGHHLTFFNKPSDAQLQAGNYRKRKADFQGLKISIENERGSVRSGVGPDGKRWETAQQHPYGYVLGTLGVDGDHFDCYVGPQANCTHAYVVTTRKPPEFTEDDEQKAMLGFPTEKAALEAFHQHYNDPRFLGDMKEMPMAEFKAKVMTTKRNPRLLKALEGEGSMILFLKSKDADGKLSGSMREKIGTVGSKHREDMPVDAFLLGKERKYPVKTKKDGAWHYSPTLLLDAARRARMEGRTEMADEADKIREKL